MRVSAETRAVHAHGIADRAADLLAEQLGHAARGGAGGEPARLEQQDPAAAEPGRVEQRQRHQRRLAGAGRRHQHRPPAGQARQAAPGSLPGPADREAPAQSSSELDHRAPCGGRILFVMGDEQDGQPGGERLVEDQRPDLATQCAVEL